MEMRHQRQKLNIMSIIKRKWRIQRKSNAHFQDTRWRKVQGEETRNWAERTGKRRKRTTTTTTTFITTIPTTTTRPTHSKRRRRKAAIQMTREVMKAPRHSGKKRSGMASTSRALVRRPESMGVRRRSRAMPHTRRRTASSSLHTGT